MAENSGFVFVGGEANEFSDVFDSYSWVRLVCNLGVERSNDNRDDSFKVNFVGFRRSKSGKHKGE